MEELFVPGWGAPSRLYQTLLPPGWTAVQPPPGHSLDEHALWLLERLSTRRTVLGGHSMGGALALLAAARRPELVERLVLVSPAGLPIVKPIRESARDFARQLAGGLYPLTVAIEGAAALAAAPRAALWLARRVRALDLRAECARVRRHRMPVRVVGCVSDTLVHCESARVLAHALGGEYVEIDSAGGHMWMLSEPAEFSSLLGSQSAPPPPAARS
jgi:pimeloyl-ACP methyl ester carboxylesterase